MDSHQFQVDLMMHDCLCNEDARVKVEQFFVIALMRKLIFLDCVKKLSKLLDQNRLALDSRSRPDKLLPRDYLSSTLSSLTK